MGNGTCVSLCIYPMNVGKMNEKKNSSFFPLVVSRLIALMDKPPLLFRQHTGEPNI